MLGCAPGCWNGDYRDRRYWAQLPASAVATSGTDYYGALAPDISSKGGTYRDCPHRLLLQGPTEEGATVTEYLGRYETRWMAHLLEGGLIYGRVDGTLIQVPLDLFPTALPDTATHIALSFDANARPVFAYEDEGTIYSGAVRRGGPHHLFVVGNVPLSVLQWRPELRRHRGGCGMLLPPDDGGESIRPLPTRTSERISS